MKRASRAGGAPHLAPSVDDWGHTGPGPTVTTTLHLSPNPPPNGAPRFMPTGSTQQHTPQRLEGAEPRNPHLNARLLSITVRKGMFMTASESSVPLEAVLMATTGLALITSTLVVALARKMRQPAVIGEILTGIILGPSILGLLPGDPVGFLFPVEIRPYLETISQVGLVLFMFTLGWELNIPTLRRHTGSIAATSLTAMVIPFGTGVLGAFLLYPRHSTSDGHLVAQPAFLLYMGTALAITAFPVLARLLVEKNMQHSRIGLTALACAALADVLAWCLLVVVIIVVQASGIEQLVFTLAGSASFIAGCLFVVRPLLNRVVPVITRSSSSVPLFLLVSAGVLLCSFTTSLIGIHAIFGAFMFGLIMPREPADVLHRTVATPMHNISTLLLPVFFITAGLSVDVTTLGPSGIMDGAIILVLACAGKFVGTIAPARLSGLDWRTSTGLGVLMNTRGLTELVVLEIGRQMHVIDGQLFTLMTLMAVVTTAMASPLLDLLKLSPDRQGRPLPPDRSGSTEQPAFQQQGT